MKTQTEGVVLRYFRYGDDAMIAHIYTENFGRQVFLFRGAKSRSTKRKMPFLQPLALVDLQLDYRPQKEMYTGNGAQPSQLFQTIPFQQIKNSIAFFIAEFLSKTLQTHEADAPLFHFLREAILFLDEENVKGTNFHLAFLVKFTTLLGIQPEIEDDAFDYLNIETGAFKLLASTNSLSREQSKLWKELEIKSWEDCDVLLLSREQRNAFLKKVLHYYSYHLQDLRQLKSLSVLQEVFE